MRDWLDGIHPDDEAEYQRNVARVDRFIADLRQYMESQGLEHSGMRGAAATGISGAVAPAHTSVGGVGTDTPTPATLPLA